MKITHFGYNFTDRGKHDAASLWAEVTMSEDGPMAKHSKRIEARPSTPQDAGTYARPVACWIPLRQKLEWLIAQQPRLCRIWVRYEDGTQKCVYWYEQGTLDI